MSADDPLATGEGNDVSEYVDTIVADLEAAQERLGDELVRAYKRSDAWHKAARKWRALAWSRLPSQLKTENEALKKEIDELSQYGAELRDESYRFESDNKRLRDEVARLREENERLRSTIEACVPYGHQRCCAVFDDEPKDCDCLWSKEALAALDKVRK